MNIPSEAVEAMLRLVAFDDSDKTVADLLQEMLEREDFIFTELIAQDLVKRMLAAALPLCGVGGWAIMDTDNEELVRVDAHLPGENWTHSGYCVVPVRIIEIPQVNP